MTDKERLEELRQYSGMTWKELAEKIGTAPQTFTDIRGGRHGISKGLASKIQSAFPDLRQEWVVFGKGPMTKQEQSRNIPLFESTNTDGGAFDESRAIGCINVGSCFPRAELAMRNTSDCMSEYPNGCILILRRVSDVNILVPGGNYVVETKEFALPKRMQKGSKENYIALYSTNESKYPDGKLIYEPFEIPMDSVMRIFSIIGYIFTQATEITAVQS